MHLKNSLYSWVSSFYPFNKQYLYAISCEKWDDKSSFLCYNNQKEIIPGVFDNSCVFEPTTLKRDSYIGKWMSGLLRVEGSKLTCGHPPSLS